VRFERQRLGVASASRRRTNACALALNATNGRIEPLLRRHVPDVVAVIDDTDHSAGTAPLFATGKR